MTTNHHPPIIDGGDAHNRALRGAHYNTKSNEADAVVDHRLAELNGVGAIIHQPRQDHPCPMCRLWWYARQAEPVLLGGAALQMAQAHEARGD